MHDLIELNVVIFFSYLLQKKDWSKIYISVSQYFHRVIHRENRSHETYPQVKPDPLYKLSKSVADLQ
jgi:hypothetical protein